MKLDWTVKKTVDFPEEQIEKIVTYIRQYGYWHQKIKDMIMEEVYKFDDADYYVWGSEQTQIVEKEIMRRLNKVSPR